MDNGNGRVGILSKYAGKTVLAFGAHPDDTELGIGGTLARLARAGARVVIVIVSIPTELERRKVEAARAAAVLGCELRLMTGDRCSRVEDLKTYELVGMVDGLIKEYVPAAVLSHGQSNFHKDHTLVYNACLASQRLSVFDLFCYFPTSCRPVSISFNPQAYVDISDTIEAKMESIRSHSSQFASRGLMADYYREIAREYGRLMGVEYAEGLEVMRLWMG